MNTKICTSIDQSKKLIELGIDVETSDMHYIEDSSDNPYCELYASKLNEEARKHYNIHYIPAWSLSALLRLIPTVDKKDEYYVETESHSDYHTVRYRNCWDGCIHSEYSKESLLDAAFEMVCRLKENNRI